jgi:predicted enzyme related to lactoylglutathione lyase
MSSEPSSFIWYELLTDDVEAATAFYSNVVGWSVTPSGQPGMDYQFWTTDGRAVGGLMALPQAAAANGMRPAWLGYVNVADVDDAIARVKRSGGSVLMPGTTIPQVGRVALVADPQGGAFYVMAPLGTGSSPSFAPGQVGHAAWNELHTTDWRAALGFYQRLLGWQEAGTMDMGPMGTYVMFNAGGAPIGGMMNSTNVPRPLWLYYFGVEEIGAAKQRVEAGGGRVVNGPHEVPGGGWMIQATDPKGTMFALFGPKKS